MYQSGTLRFPATFETFFLGILLLVFIITALETQILFILGLSLFGQRAGRRKSMSCLLCVGDTFMETNKNKMVSLCKFRVGLAFVRHVESSFAILSDGAVDPDEASCVRVPFRFDPSDALHLTAPRRVSFAIASFLHSCLRQQVRTGTTARNVPIDRSIYR